MRKKILFFLSFYILASFHLAFSQTCEAPTNVIATSITSNSAVIGWTDTTPPFNWNLEIFVNGMTSGNQIIQGNPYTLTGLPCGSTVSIRVSALCNATTTSQPSTMYSFTTLTCPTEFGQPQNLFTCMNSSALACFNLESNNPIILGNQSATEYNVSYHLTQADAVNLANPIASPYCVPQGVYTLFSRVTKIADGSSMQISTFTISANNFQQMPPLSTLAQCDDNGNGIIVYDLTTAQALLNTTNTLSYYTSLTNAENQTNAISNPAAYALSTTITNSVIYVRENQNNNCDLIYPRTLVAQPNCNLAFACANANSLCNSLDVPFVNTTNSLSNGQAGCLGSTPNPTWFYLPISQSGTINLKITQGNNAPLYNNQDVDYIIYGPFTTATQGCGQIPFAPIVNCSYSAAATEYPIIPNAQAGQYYLMMVTNFSNQQGFITIHSLPTSTGIINCSGFTFNAFLDANANGTKDAGEVNFPLGNFSYEKNNDGIIHNITAPTGTFNLYDNVPTNTYNASFTVNPVYASNYTVSVSNYTAISPGAGMTSYYFPVTANQNYNDLGVTVIPVNAPRPGFNYINKIVYSNLGNQTISSGTITFTKPGAVSINSTNPSTNNTTEGFTYDFTNLLPFEVRTIDVNMAVPAVPIVNANDYLTSSASIVPLSGDIVTENNSNTLTQIVVNAYDPNDKLESHGTKIIHSTFTSNDYLYYTIRFENTGNASAINIRINDILNSKLDENTLMMVNASHPYEMDRIGTNLTWRFNNIQLPVSVAGSNVGKGYVSFKIKPIPGYAVGDLIPNTASIYFDFNPAIVTNTFTTEFVAFLNADGFGLNDTTVYPNPIQDVLYVQTNENHTIQSLAIYNLVGSQVLKQNPNNSNVKIDLGNLSSGVYLLELTSSNQEKIVKKIIKK